MSYKDIIAGEKLARAKAARFIKSSKGTPGIEIRFDFEENGQPESLNWVGWLSPNAIENTMDTLVHVLDFNGNDNTDANGVLSDPSALNYQKQVKLVVEMETYEKDGQQKTAPRIKWVNNVGGSAFGACQPEEVKAVLQSVGFKAAFLAAKQGNNKPKPKESEVPF